MTKDYKEILKKIDPFLKLTPEDFGKAHEEAKKS